MSMNARFLPWVRYTPLSGDAIRVRAAGRDVSVPISRYGPGDVTGIAPALIRRRDPVPGSLGMPPNLFPSIEFARPDFPWCRTPGAPDASGQLQPWLALVVVEARGGSPLGSIAGAKLPVVEVARGELPAADELSYWAHVQVDAAAAMSEDSAKRGIARILSPRALSPNTRYAACLVPAFEAGRLAGLGKDVTDARSTDPAWTPGTGTVVLPVYDSWLFTTTDSGDLETLARRLRGRDLAATSEPLKLDVSQVSGDVGGKLAPFEGALRPLDAAATWSGPAVNASAKKLRSNLERKPVNGVPVVGLPLYGSIASGQTQPAPGWLEDLNLDPRRRSAAGLGVEMVRAHQEELVDEAWRQAGDIERARREREGALLADLATARLHARAIAPLAGAHALVTMAPALSRMRDPGSVTFAARVASSVLPAPALGAAFRRILATKTPPASRNAGQGIRSSLTRQNAAVVSPGALPATPARLVTDATVKAAITPGGHGGVVGGHGGVVGGHGGVLAGGGLTHPVVGTVGPTLQPATPVTLVTPVTPAITPFEPATPLTLVTPVSPAVLALTSTQTTMLATFTLQAAVRKPAVVEVVRPESLAWPSPPEPAGPATAAARFATRVTFGDGARLFGGRGVVATPRFEQPLAAWLDPGLLLAGVDIPPDSAGLLEVNAPFVEALIVAANHELARELLWRGVPLDRVSTPLTRFFESRVSAAPRDMQATAGWNIADRLGSHVAFGERVVLILRSRLVTHLAETAIFLAKAEPDGEFRKPGETHLMPVFRGPAGLDTAYFGFEITPEDLASDPGWYVVIQELSGAVRFGFDEEGTTPMKTWNDLAWPMVGMAGGYVAVEKEKPAPAQPEGLVWGRDSAHMAGISLQRPIRLSIHTSLLLPEKT